MKSWKNVTFLWVGICFLGLVSLPQVVAQCKLLSPNHLRQISKADYKNKIRLLDHRLASNISIDEDDQKCEYRTYVRCKNFISDTQWHWAEILTLNSCDEKLTYSTANQKHFARIKGRLKGRGATNLGERSYGGLDFEVFRSKRGLVVEFNEHPNEQGKMFYLVNILWSK